MLYRNQAGDGAGVGVRTHGRDNCAYLACVGCLPNFHGFVLTTVTED